MNYQDTLSLIMEINDYSLIPNYNYDCSLGDLENDRKLENFCYEVLKDLQSLININK